MSYDTVVNENPLRTWRKGKGFRIVDIAGYLKVTARAVMDYESGAYKPKAEVLERLSLLQQRHLDDLIEDWNAWYEYREGRMPEARK